jgi:RNA recognition motif-containing protein
MTCGGTSCLSVNSLGDLKSIEIVKDDRNNPKGFAYVEFEETEDAEEAIFNTREAEFFDKILKVQKAKRRQAPLDKAVWDTADYHKKYLEVESPDQDITNANPQ